MVDFERGAARYHMLEATRQYALERLEQHGERAPIAQRHALAFLRLAERLDRDWYCAAERSWFREAKSKSITFAGRWLVARPSDTIWLRPGWRRRWRASGIPLAARGTAMGSARDRLLRRRTPLDVLARLSSPTRSSAVRLASTAPALSAAKQALEYDEELDELQRARAKQAAGRALGALGSASRREIARGRPRDLAQLNNRRMQAIVLNDLGTARSRCGDIAGARDSMPTRWPITRRSLWNGPRRRLRVISPRSSLRPATPRRRYDSPRKREPDMKQPRIAARPERYVQYNRLPDRSRLFRGCPRLWKRALSVLREVKQTVLTAYALQHLAAVERCTRSPISTMSMPLANAPRCWSDSWTLG